MQTKQIIQSSANVIRITKLAKGNLYKRFDDGDYTYYGIVTDVLNDGVNTIITSTEYKKSWSSMDCANKVIKGEKDYVLFPATIEEIQNEFQSVIESKEKSIESNKKAIKEAEDIIEVTKKLISGEMQKELTLPEFREMTQSEFNQKMEQIGI